MTSRGSPWQARTAPLSQSATPCPPGSCVPLRLRRGPSPGASRWTSTGSWVTPPHVQFTYQQPQPLSVDPKQGPQAGGTTLTISGTHLDTGSEEDVRVTLNDVPCKVTQFGAQLQCVTGPQSVLGSCPWRFTTGLPGAQPRRPSPTARTQCYGPSNHCEASSVVAVASTSRARASASSRDSLWWS